MILKIVIFALGLAGSSYPVKGEVTTPALSFISREINLVTMKKEVWKDVVGFENYLVSSYGRVKSKDRVVNHIFGKAKRKSTFVNPSISRGYHLVAVYKAGKRYSRSIHRLVAQAFIPNPENKPQVNHINSDRSDNRVENLEWCTVQENIIHGWKYGNIEPTVPWKGKFGKDHHASKTILQMNDEGEVLNEFVGICHAARVTGISQPNISNCCLGKRLKHAGGYVWKYKDV